MNKNLILGIAIIVIILIILGICLVLKDNTSSKNMSNNSNISTNNVTENNEIESDKKILIVYYSATGNTKKVSEEMANILNADIFEIEPVDKYTSEDLDWTNKNSRVSREHDDVSLRNVPLKNTKVENWDSYDTVLIGYPIWWGIASWTVDNFVKDNDFTGKTVIPFCTSTSSNLGNSGELLEDMAGTGEWKEGHRFVERPTEEQLKTWLNEVLK